MLAACLAGTPRPAEALERLIEPGGNRALFGTVVERLADLFEPRLCGVYAELFSEVISRVVLDLHADQLLERYARVRQPRRFDRDPLSIDHVYVLSRVTLGADVAVTSIVLDAVKQLFPNASLYFVGPEKSWELFAADSALEHLPISYGRSGALLDRLSIWPELREALSTPRSIVIDPDSRLTQLGLLPVCAEENYYFFESRSYGGDSDEALPDLTRRWVAQTFGIEKAKPFISPLPATGNPADVTISLGVGENAAKRIPDPFEENLLRFLVDRESSILVDRGAGGEEAERVERAAAHSGGRVGMWDGSFAGFAARIARSSLYIGYDSAGGHVAAASGVPMVSIFGGFASERMFQRWRPVGPGPIQVIRAGDAGTTLGEVMASLPLLNRDLH